MYVQHPTIPTHRIYDLATPGFYAHVSMRIAKNRTNIPADGYTEFLNFQRSLSTGCRISRDGVEFEGFTLRAVLDLDSGLRARSVGVFAPVLSAPSAATSAPHTSEATDEVKSDANPSDSSSRSPSAPNPKQPLSLEEVSTPPRWALDHHPRSRRAQPPDVLEQVLPLRGCR